jgi:hypothetical protein
MATPLALGPELAGIVSYEVTGGLVYFEMPLGTPVGTQASWRIFPLDASGAVMPGTTGSDAQLVLVE